MNDNTAERKSVADPTARFPPMNSLQVRAFALPYNRG
jgi:hypothetical protein